MRFFTNPNYDFVRWRWHAIVLSLIVILAGMSLIATRGLQKGVDFEGGTIVILKFDQAPDLARIRGALATSMPGGGDAVVQNYGDAQNNTVMIRVRRTGEEIGGDLSKEVDAILAAMKQSNVGSFKLPPEGTEIVLAAFLPDAAEALIHLRRFDEANALIEALEHNGARLDRAWQKGILALNN